MDIKNSVEFRKGSLEKYDTLKHRCYDYAKNGILTKSLPKLLFKGNTIFVTFLQLMDMKFIFLFKYIDRLKRFKYITSYV